MSKTPFISIVIPTRNRGNLLRYALQSALEQDFNDYEIIVSNNCSQDSTAEIIREVGGSRVRQIQPDRVLSMPDHWEFALEQAQGRYVTYLCDDDAWSPDALRRAAAVIDSSGSKLLALNSAVYYSPNWFEKSQQNIAVVLPYTGKVLECDSSQTLNELFKCGILYQAPRMINSFCDRETMLRVRAESQKMFLMCPDYSFSAFMLSEIPAWIYIDEPLHVQGVFPEGIGSAGYYNRGEPAQEFVREFKETKILKRVPLQAPVVTNYITETLMMAKERRPSKLAGYEVDWKHYFINCWRDISTHENNGVVVDDDKNEFLRVLAQQPQELQDAVCSVITPEPTSPEPSFTAPNPIKNLARRVINSSTVLMNFESLVRKREVALAPQVEPEPVSGPTIFKGEEAGFENILECAKRLPTLLENANNALGSLSI